MEKYKSDFITLCLNLNVIRFGEFTLKSGRKSPYFFNAGLLNTGLALAKIGEYYAQLIQQSAIDFDVLFGPAYKGIPLVSAAAIALATKYKINKPYGFNRKQIKSHGEGGDLVGAPLSGRVFIIDDVITAGTAIRESIHKIEQSGGQLAGVAVLIDRQERGLANLSAIQEIKEQYAVPVLSIINLDDIIGYLEYDTMLQSNLNAVREYRNNYGI